MSANFQFSSWHECRLCHFCFYLTSYQKASQDLRYSGGVLLERLAVLWQNEAASLRAQPWYTALGSTCRSGQMILLDCSGSNSKHGTEGRVRQLGIRWFWTWPRLGCFGGRLSGTAGQAYFTRGNMKEWWNASVLLHLWKPLPKQEETLKLWSQSGQMSTGVADNACPHKIKILRSSLWTSLGHHSSTPAACSTLCFCYSLACLCWGLVWSKCSVKCTTRFTLKP